MSPHDLVAFFNMKLMACLIALATLVFLVPTQQATSQSLAFTHVTVIDMTGAPPKQDMTVIVKGDRIESIQKTERKLPRAIQVIDASGKFLIPGLWDMHVHFTETERTFSMFIANGVTGVRNMGGDLDDLLRWRNDVASGKLPGPQIVMCGPIIDGPQPAAHGPTLVVSSPIEGRRAVDMLKSRNADCVKVYDRLPRDAYFAIIDEAKKLNIPVVGHVPLAITSVEASEAGQKSIEHLGSFLESASTLEDELLKAERSNEPVTDPSDFPKRIAARGETMLNTYDETRAQKIFATFIKNKTWQVPTLEFKWAQTFLDDITQQGDPRLKFIPASEQQWWTPKKNFFARYRTPEYIVFRKHMFQKEMDLVGAMHKAGVPFMTGTDLSGAYVFAGFSLHHELELFVQAGFTPMEALQAATLNPALFLNEQDKRGTVEPGKIADLVLLDANPLDDIRNTQKINGVVLSGRYLSRLTLDKMLSDVAESANKENTK
ncbi:MAG: amidohydrolase [Blastocatellia bacterium]|nr:MAG: amidohydrolase [Blastocatellia bacterium]